MARDAAHPRLLQQPAIVIALYDERGGETQPAPIDLVSENMARQGAYGGRGMVAARGFVSFGEVAGTRLKMHPANIPSMELRLDHIAWPEEVREEGGGVYRGLPPGLLSAAVSQAAREVSWWARSWQDGLDRTAARRMASARAFQLKVEQLGPRFINYAYSAFAAA